ncbi:MAG: ABC transporter ATP-binding protein [Deltaproteobacteria bacterium]|nr:ABC transporter ATP-binding protein [Deltaproteobacteria bacterium]
MNAVGLNRLSKTFTKEVTWGDIFRFRFRRVETPALNGVTASFRQGTITGIAGRNGSGKTTLLKVISALIFPNTGSCSVFGLDTVKESGRIRGMCGFSFGEERSWFLRLSGLENLIFFASLYGIGRKEAAERSIPLLRRLEMDDLSARPVLAYSSGMKQRLSIARALICRPRLLLLDEITKGLDPGFQHKIFDLLEDETAKTGITVVLASHNLSELRICSEIFLLEEGGIVCSGDFASVKPEMDRIFYRQ